jgi:1,4-alpha-glucan branching enzyme
MPSGYLIFVLHAHLPYVHHPEYDRFLEERWLFEAMTETYLPLLCQVDRLRSEGIGAKLTLSLSPTLVAMLEDPLLQQRYDAHLELCLRLADAEINRTRGEPELHRLAWMYRALFEQIRDVFVQRCGRELSAAFRALADDGRLELITCAATHGFLPALAAHPPTVRAQVFAAVAEHERVFGRKPQGFWLPECGFFPGLDEVLAEAGIRYFFVDSHGLEHATPSPLFGVSSPVFCPSGVAAFARQPLTSKLVWSSKVGYPADPHYREYYRDIGYDLDSHYLEPFQHARGVRTATGIKYHRVTGPSAHKQLYDPDAAQKAAERHARDFVHRCREHVLRVARAMPFPPAIVSPYDAELLGHWWFEGPQWLYSVLRELGSGGELSASTPSEYLASHPVQQKGMPAPSTWGRNGYAEQWINSKTQGLWRPLHEAARRMEEAARARAAAPPGGVEERLLRQAGRELMLAQSSDWPFAITNGTTEQYARRRFQDHLARFHDLLDDLDQRRIDPEKIEALEYMDSILPSLDPRLFTSPGA